MRTRTLVLLSALLTAAAIAVTVLVGPSPAARIGVPRREVPVEPDPAAHNATAALRAWDRRRAEAWGRADTEALASLYAPGSEAGRRDVAMLRAYRSRGLRVQGLVRQVLSVREVRSSPHRLALTVTDRLAGGVVAGHGVRAALPVGAWATRRIVLRRLGGTWAVATVADVGAQPAG